MNNQSCLSQLINGGHGQYINSQGLKVKSLSYQMNYKSRDWNKLKSHKNQKAQYLDIRYPKTIDCWMEIILKGKIKKGIYTSTPKQVIQIQIQKNFSH